MEGKQQVTIYVSNNCSESNKLIHFLKELGISYEIKNITEDKKNLKELQEQHIYATPVTMVNNHKILGFQKHKLESELIRL
ncbi:Glutaredoxin [Paraliobacillus sp. PM-2]|uniref:glutaredoxin family protein n=1 Tax=Paraliobacillus sp. PM-2 TaxID=1462524 RepID=UPI00061BFB6E|nr:glutaredoxin family protein [Paraliobacillus sp. PM-2]CQR48278.1 Glutaredoxin [Paraliobacillus sp. PM-2]